MATSEQLITANLGIWSSAIKTKSAAGRGKSNKLELYGIKKLRELILELAVRGLLVPQDPNDEPASDLLKKIAAEKARLIKEKKIKKPKALPAIEEDDKQFELPEGWQWVRLAEIGFTQTGATPKKADAHHYGQFMPFIKPGDIDEGEILSYENDGLSKEGASSLGRVAPEDSLLMVCIGTIGKCARINRDVAFNQQINTVTPYVQIGGYILKALQSAYFQSIAWDASSSTTLSILNKGKWEKLPVPLPPIEEQARIVTKVDELMALCDQLEQQQESSITAHQTLVQTLLDALTTASERDDFTAAWTRIADHFDTLFTTEWSIDQLKQTILQLAVMGKLVPQDPKDEPASELLKKIFAKKTQLIKEKKIKKQNVLKSLEEGEEIFELPEGWGFARFGDLLDFSGGGQPPKSVFSDQKLKGYVQLIQIRDLGPRPQPVYIPRDSVSKFCTPEDVMIGRYGASVGKVFWGKDGAYNVALIKLHNDYGAYIPHFLFLLMISPVGQRLFSGISRSAQAGFKKGDIESKLLPVLSSEEQQRIVAKVDEFMAFCDLLKARFIAAQITQLQLADAMAEQAVT